MELYFKLVMGICWSIVYIECIRIGFKEKTYAMPIFALALNIAWELIHSFTYLSGDIGSAQGWINAIWFILDAIIVYTYFKYGKKDFTKYAHEKLFVPWSILIFAIAFILQYYAVTVLGESAARYTAYSQNVIMSILYINMLVTRHSTIGQNLVIAVNKWIGTLSAVIMTGIFMGNKIVLLLGTLCTVFDLIYIYILTYGKKYIVLNNNSSDIAS